MAKPSSIKVTVINITTDRPVVSNVSVTDAAKAIGLKYKTFYHDMNRGSIVSGKYRIVITGILPKEIETYEDFKWAEDFMNRWDEMYWNFQKIKRKLRRTA
jgi:hypothetical protein